VFGCIFSDGVFVVLLSRSSVCIYGRCKIYDDVSLLGQHSIIVEQIIWKRQAEEVKFTTDKKNEIENIYAEECREILSIVLSRKLKTYITILDIYPHIGQLQWMTGIRKNT
jgi:hypothetical protein